MVVEFGVFVQQGWKMARDRIKAIPAINDGLPDPREDAQQQRTN